MIISITDTTHVTFRTLASTHTFPPRRFRFRRLSNSHARFTRAELFSHNCDLISRKTAPEKIFIKKIFFPKKIPLPAAWTGRSDGSAGPWPTPDLRRLRRAPGPTMAAARSATRGGRSARRGSSPRRSRTRTTRGSGSGLARAALRYGGDQVSYWARTTATTVAGPERRRGGGPRRPRR